MTNPMTTQEKDAFILATSEKFSLRQLDVTGKGSAIKALKDGKSITPKTRERLYSRALELTGETVNNISETSTIKTAIPMNSNMLQEFSNVIESQKGLLQWQEDFAKVVGILTAYEKKNSELESRIVELEKTKTELTKSIASKYEKESIAESKAIEITSIEQTQDQETKSVLGFTLFHDAMGRWYGIRRFNGKNRSVYIGRDRSKAESKLSNWLWKEGLSHTTESKV